MSHTDAPHTAEPDDGRLVLALDAYGTLFDLRSVAQTVQEVLGDEDTALFERTWREKQIEYTFRRGLMRDYAPFSTCIADALDFTAFRLEKAFTPAARTRLIDAYRELAPYPEVHGALTALREAGYALWVLTNGAPDDVSGMLERHDLARCLEGVVSVDEIQSFKPNPEVYQHFLDRTGASLARSWMVSGNTFDFIGAMAFGMKGVYVMRAEDVVFDPWKIEPTLVVPDLDYLEEALARVGDS